jgi:hypothetical protein
MADLIARHNGAIPIRQLRSKVLHRRVNKVVESKIEVSPVFQGGASILKVEDIPVEVLISPPPKEVIPVPEIVTLFAPEEKKVDITVSDVVKVDELQESQNEEKEKTRKYSKRRSNK